MLWRNSASAAPPNPAPFTSMSILDEIFAHKRREVAENRRVRSLAEMERTAQLTPSPLDFVSALKVARDRYNSPALIAEIKRASPSRGLLASHLDPPALARLYGENGAAGISVLTDCHYFLGSLDDLTAVVHAGTGLPVLRKDFICDPYQVFEARTAGADAVLLIVAGLEPAALFELHSLICATGMTPLVEVHNLQELEIALACHPVLIGVNNRDLRDFSVDLKTSLSLRNFIPPEICMVAESGIHSPADVRKLSDAGVDAILVGEALVTADDISLQVRRLICRA